MKIFAKILILSLLLLSCVNEDFGLDLPHIPSVLYFYAEPETIDKGGTAQLLWGVEEGNYTNEQITIEAVLRGDTLNWTDLDYVDTLSVSPDSTTTYLLVAKNGAGSSRAEITIEVIQ